MKWSLVLVIVLFAFCTFTAEAVQFNDMYPGMSMREDENGLVTL